MPNETPKSKCCNAAIFHDHQIGGWKCAKCLMLVVPPNQCTCGLQAHPQPNCPAAKQSNCMPDVIYADCFRVKSWTTLPKEALTPYIRKSIHDGGMSLANDIIAKRDNEVTKLKSALKECVEVIMEMIDESGGEYHTDHNCPEDDTCECPLANRINNAITSAKGLYE